MLKPDATVNSGRQAESAKVIGKRLGVASIAATIVVFALLVSSPAGAVAALPAPGWTVESFATPTDFSSSHNAKCLEDINELIARPLCDLYRVEVRNAGSVSSSGAPVTITDSLPVGVTVRQVELYSSEGVARGPIARNPASNEASAAGCTIASVIRCELTEAANLTPTVAGGALVLFISVTVDEPASTGPLRNIVTVSGGGAPPATVTQENQIATTPAPFGPASFDFHVAGRDGASDTLAGDHPYEVTTTINLNNVLEEKGFNTQPFFTSVEDLKDVVVDLPLGFAGSTRAAPQCTIAALSTYESQHPASTGCPKGTVVGQIFSEPAGGGESVKSPIWNLVPEHGVPAEFGYVDEGGNTHVLYARPMPTPNGYVLRVTTLESPQILLSRVVVKFFGDPAERAGLGDTPIPFFTNPTACTGAPLKTTIWMDSWQHPGSNNPDGSPNLGNDPNWVSKTSESPPVTGCDQLTFDPSLSAQPTTHAADSPSGLDFELKLPQPEAEGVRATPAQRNATVVLPEGVTLDPSAANGLAACSTAQIGWLGGSPVNFSPDPPECPDASKLGTLEVTSPLIPGVLSGAIYLARQNENPFGSVLAGYVVIDDPLAGVLVKIAGELKTDPRSGRVTGIFDNNPQLPFSDLKLHFFGGSRGGLATPENCGAFTINSVLEPWSAPASGPNAMPFDTFQINEGCVNGFAPTFTAGSANPQAGAYSPFVASFARNDTDQELAGATVSLPPGLLGKISGVPLCPDAQATAGTCPEASRVGSVTAGAGPGPNPLFVTGSAYLTGPYNGAPYGMSVVVPAVVGPFNFGNVVVRQSLRIDPHTAQVTDVSDPFPTILDVTGPNGQTDGVPIKLRRVDVNIDLPNFTLNPTSCAALHVTASLTSTQQVTATSTTPFQAANCAALRFAPKLTANAAGKASKANGTTLNIDVSSAGIGQANIAKVALTLPKALPSRLTTIQKACLASVFEANPASCDEGSVIGMATIHTPLLPNPLSGPAYLVSHGGAAFPDVEFVLQGNDVTIVLDGKTDIKKGITYSRFESAPDAPFTSFETTLPAGPHSALTSNVAARKHFSLCGESLSMPTVITGQNGAVIKQNTKVPITGCPKIKALTRAQKLAKAMKACRKKPKRKRPMCARESRRKYGPLGKKTSRKANRTL